MKPVICALWICVVCTSASVVGAEPKPVQVGDSIAAFNANDDQGNLWQSATALAKGKYLVVYFYPAALTGGCTTQACTYRDHTEDLAKLGIQIVGVSGDPVNNLKRFKQAHALNFPLLSDVNGFIANRFGVPLRSGGVFETTLDNETVTLIRPTTASRWTFVLNDQGKVIYKDTQVNVQQDAVKVIAFIKGLD